MLKLYGSNFVYRLCVLFWQGGRRGVGWGGGGCGWTVGLLSKREATLDRVVLASLGKPLMLVIYLFLNKIWTELGNKSACFVIGFFKIKEKNCIHLSWSVILLFQKVHTGTWYLYHMLWFLEYVHGTYST